MLIKNQQRKEIFLKSAGLYTSEFLKRPFQWQSTTLNWPSVQLEEQWQMTWEVRVAPNMSYAYSVCTRILSDLNV